MIDMIGNDLGFSRWERVLKLPRFVFAIYIFFRVRILGIQRAPHLKHLFHDLGTLGDHKA